MRSARLVKTSPTLDAQIQRLVPHSDEKARFLVGWWLRMHRKRNPLVAAVLKFIEWPDDNANPQRFVWEVCRWPRARSHAWTFVCWMIDGVGMWMKSFPSKRVAIAYFRSKPSDVMARVKQPRSDDGSERDQCKAAS